jgi:hypothetical protein
MSEVKIPSFWDGDMGRPFIGWLCPAVFGPGAAVVAATFSNVARAAAACGGYQEVDSDGGVDAVLCRDVLNRAQRAETATTTTSAFSTTSAPNALVMEVRSSS